MKRYFVLAILIAAAVAPTLALAQGQPCTPGSASSTLCNAFAGFGGATDLKSFVIAALTWLATIIGTLTLIMVIYSGARMIFAQGDPKAIGEAKASLTYSIGGLIVVVFAYVIISSIEYFLAVRTGLEPGSTNVSRNFFINPLTDRNLMSFVTNTIKSFLSIVGAAAMFYIILSGFRYMTARGNAEQTEKAKEGLKWSIIGLVSIILSYMIVTVVVNTIQ